MNVLTNAFQIDCAGRINPAPGRQDRLLQPAIEAYRCSGSVWCCCCWLAGGGAAAGRGGGGGGRSGAGWRGTTSAGTGTSAAAEGDSRTVLGQSSLPAKHPILESKTGLFNNLDVMTILLRQGWVCG